jgi:hypothetical protein
MITGNGGGMTSDHHHHYSTVSSILQTLCARRPENLCHDTVPSFADNWHHQHAMLEGQPSTASVIRDLLGFVGEDRVIIAHNAARRKFFRAGATASSSIWSPGGTESSRTGSCA